MEEMMTDREKLIEEAAKSMVALAPGEDWDDCDREWYLRDARVALAVFEKAHTPTDDERETLRKAVSDAVYGDERVTLGTERLVDSLWAAGFRRPEAPAPVFPDQSIAEAVEIMREAETHRTTRPEPQGEPSDAHGEDWSDHDIDHPEEGPSCKCGFNGSPDECAASREAALRAAGGVR